MRRVVFFLGLLWAGAAHAQTPCPTGYVLVPNESTYGLGNFCVAKYEMKNVGGIATSQASGTPWINISQTTAIAECRELGTDYHLITNDEWMVIARNVENTASNWSGGAVGSGALNRGHTDNGPANLLTADANDALACHNTGQTCSDTVWNDQRRTFTLSNGSVVWDLGGNAFELTSWVVPDTDKASPGSSFVEINSTSPTTSMPQKSYWPSNPSFTSAHRTGKYFGGLSGSGGAGLRGASYSINDLSRGIYTLLLSENSSYTSITLGFRCAFQVKPQDYTGNRAPSWQIMETRHYGEATTVDFALFDLLGVNLKTDAVDGGLDCTIIKDEGAETACANDFVDEGSTYSISLTALEMSAKQITICIVDADSPDVYLPKCFKIFTTTSGMGQ